MRGKGWGQGWGLGCASGLGLGPGLGLGKHLDAVEGIFGAADILLRDLDADTLPSASGGERWTAEC